jgi:hypothetical protein
MVRTPFDRLLIAVGDAGAPFASVAAVADELPTPTPADELRRRLDKAVSAGYLARNDDGEYKLTGVAINLLYS